MCRESGYAASTPTTAVMKAVPNEISAEFHNGSSVIDQSNTETKLSNVRLSGTEIDTVADGDTEENTIHAIGTRNTTPIAIRTVLASHAERRFAGVATEIR